jgi:hypothetical protein
MRISENPNKRSSTGAAAILNPHIELGEYITIFLEVNHQLVSNWNGKIIA